MMLLTDGIFCCISTIDWQPQPTVAGESQSMTCRDFAQGLICVVDLGLVLSMSFLEAARPLALSRVSSLLSSVLFPDGQGGACKSQD